MRALALLALAALAPTTLASGAGDLLFAATFEGPLAAPTTATLATFDVPEGYTSVVASLVDRHVVIGGAFARSAFLLVDPEDYPVPIHDGAFTSGVYTCLSIECHEAPGGGTSALRPALAGSWRIDHEGATTATYTVEVRGLR